MQVIGSRKDLVVTPGFRTKFPIYFGSTLLCGVGIMFFFLGSLKHGFEFVLSSLIVLLWGRRKIRRTFLKVNSDELTYGKTWGQPTSVKWSEITNVKAPKVSRDHITICSNETTLDIPIGIFERGTIPGLIELIERKAPAAKIESEVERHRSKFETLVEFKQVE